jgi:hypothetical protein
MSTDTNATPPESTEPPAKAGCLVRAFIIILPLGLAFMVPMSLWVYYQKKYAPKEAASRLAPMLQRELNADDLARYAQGFSQSIGDRSLSNPDNLKAAAGYVESTMGFANMGYNIQRQNFEVGSQSLSNLIAELPGKKGTKDTVLVLADYDSPDAGGIAAMMCVAHAMVGTSHTMAIRFVAVTQGDVEDTKANGIEQVAKKLGELEIPISAVVLLRPPLKTTPAAWQHAKIIPLAAELKDLTPTPLDMLQRVKKAVEDAAADGS